MAENANTEVTSNADVDQQETVEALKAKLAELDSTVSSLNAEATKHKALRRQAEKERDEIKNKAKAVDTSEQDYKALWQQTNEKLTKVQERAKSSDIRTALTEQLSKTKVASDKLGAALKLVDAGLIEWDEEAGVDKHSVTAAVQKLKSEHSFLFEGVVDPTEVKNPGDATSKNTITRATFDMLSPKDKAAKMKAGVRLID